MLTITTRFNVFGYQCPEVNLTPALGILFLIGTVLLIGANTF